MILALMPFVDELFKDLVLYRLMYPKSKLKITEYLNRYEQKIYSEDDIYRYMDKLHSSQKELYVALTYSRKIAPQLSVGATAKYLLSNFSKTQSASVSNNYYTKTVTFDAGATYKQNTIRLAQGQFTASATFTNCGPEVTYFHALEKDPLPLKALAGIEQSISVHLNIEILLTGYYGKYLFRDNYFKQEYGGGISGTYGEMVTISVGFHNSETVDNPTPFLTGGIGLEIGVFYFDGSYHYPINHNGNPYYPKINFGIGIYFG